MITIKPISRLILFAAVALLTACNPPPQATPATPEAIRQQIMQSYAPLTLVHVWATWCEPCREEFPDLLKAYNNFRDDGLQLILVSADDPELPKKVNTFLQQQKSPVNSLISTQLNEDFIESLSPDWSGVLPSTFFYGPDGKLLSEWEGMRSYDHYVTTIQALINQTTGGTP
jgi:thiol-disulfide isomerase/thioredoxin